MTTRSHRILHVSLNEDDGGSAKNDYRKKRRDIRKLMSTFALVFCIIFFLGLRILWSNLTDYPEQAWKESSFYHDGIQKYRWSDPRMLPPIPDDQNSVNKVQEILLSALEKKKQRRKSKSSVFYETKQFFRFRRMDTDMKWEIKADQLLQNSHLPGPKVDYTAIKYSYPNIIDEPPVDGQYPSVKPLKEILQDWDQNNFDNPPQPFQETLLHFDYSDEHQREIAKKYRDLEIPFKLYNVPELQAASLKWTDEYVSNRFDTFSILGEKRAQGHAQEV